MKPPRYLLREAVVKKILRHRERGRFLEIGYGQGQMLVTLAGMGFRGDGYDRSRPARRAAEDLLRSRGVTGITLLDELNDGAEYDYILFFEVLGYWQDPAREMARLGRRLKPGGAMIFSFSNQRSAGHAEKRTGEMQCYTRSQVIAMVEGGAGLVVDQCWNYGFPLTNMLKPVLDLFHRIRPRGGPEDREQEADNSGLAGRFLPVRLASLILNAVTISPFVVMQDLFRDSDLGTGYVVVAEKTGPRQGAAQDRPAGPAGTTTETGRRQ
jgi:SAM-dependent methyltransferase